MQITHNLCFPSPRQTWNWPFVVHVQVWLLGSLGNHLEHIIYTLAVRILKLMEYYDFPVSPKIGFQKRLSTEVSLWVRRQWARFLAWVVELRGRAAKENAGLGLLPYTYSLCLHYLQSPSCLILILDFQLFYSNYISDHWPLLCVSVTVLITFE